MVSLVAFINASIIQGSVIVPPSYVVAASDLHPSNADNHTYLLVGSSNIPTLNGLKRGHLQATFGLTPSKTASWSSTETSRTLTHWAPPDLSVGAHLNVILSNSASSIHALRMLRTHGLLQQQIQEVARTTIIASLLYASPAWWGFTIIRDKERLKRLMKRLRRAGYLSEWECPLFFANGRVC